MHECVLEALTVALRDAERLERLRLALVVARATRRVLQAQLAAVDELAKRVHALGVVLVGVVERLARLLLLARLLVHLLAVVDDLLPLGEQVLVAERLVVAGWRAEARYGVDGLDDERAELVVGALHLLVLDGERTLRSLHVHALGLHLLEVLAHPLLVGRHLERLALALLQLAAHLQYLIVEVDDAILARFEFLFHSSYVIRFGIYYKRLCDCKLFDEYCAQNGELLFGVDLGLVDAVRIDRLVVLVEQVGVGVLALVQLALVALDLARQLADRRVLVGQVLLHGVDEADGDRLVALDRLHLGIRVRHGVLTLALIVRQLLAQLLDLERAQLELVRQLWRVQARPCRRARRRRHCYALRARTHMFRLNMQARKHII